MKLPLILDYEIYDEDGPCAPYFTGRITDAEGRVICSAENEERAAELVDYVNALLARHAALEARHNALRESIHNAMERTVGCDKKQTDDQLIADVAYLKRLASDHFKTSIDCGNRVFAVEQKYDALRDAVAWEREFDEVLVWLVRTGRYPRDMGGKYDLAAERDCARAEVDRLIAEGQ